MSPNPETRKLAAVVFADIEGYTALFQRDETAAIKQVQVHRKDLEELSGKYKGEIIQFYGDGSVTIFNSVIDAIHSSIALQILSMEQSIPIRIGIHMGDLIYKDNDIFGDVVNVTSRIQSAGIAGAILVSKKVADELNNHPDINLLPLGKFALKNVGEELDLFAITGSGLKVPPIHKPAKKHTFYSSRLFLILMGVVVIFGAVALPLLRKSSVKKFTDERFAIAPFENLTSNPDLDEFSSLAAGWLITHLKDYASPINIMELRSSLLYSNGDLSLFTKNPAALRKTGCIYQIRGTFNPWGQKGDSLEFNATVFDVRSDKAVIFLQKAYCAADNPWDGMRQMANVIKGFWKGKKEKVLSYPKNDAFEAYLEAVTLWGGSNEDEGKPFLIKAIRLDSSFMDPYFLLMDLFYNTGEPLSALDTLKLIQFRFKDLDERQKNFLRFHEEDINGNRLAAWQYFLNELHKDSIDLMYITSGMVMGMEYLNDPKTTLKIDQYYSRDSINLNTCDYCRTRLLQAMKAHVALGEFKKAGELADRVKLLVERTGEYISLINYYMAVNDTFSINTLLSNAENDTSKHYLPLYYLNLLPGREAMLQGNIALRNYYAERAIKACKGKEGRPLARGYYLKGDLEKAIRIYEKTWLKETDEEKQTLALGEMGLIYAQKKQLEKANDIIIQLDRMKKRFDYGEISYLQGKIKAHLGETASAITYLSKSLDEGQRFKTGVTFQYDPDLMILNTEVEYLKLLDRNKQM